jgi:hypothetical protein
MYRVSTEVEVPRIHQHLQLLWMDGQRRCTDSILSPFLRTKSGGAVLPLTVVTPLSKACFCIEKTACKSRMKTQCEPA